MDEKIIVKSEQYVVKKLFKIMAIVGAILSVLMFVNSFFQSLSYHISEYADYEETHYLHQEHGCDYDHYLLDEGVKCWNCQDYEQGAFLYALENTFSRYNFLTSIIPFASLSLIGGLIYLWLRSYEMTVTDKRVYGKVAWGKRVDLPLDSISSTSTIALFKGVAVATSSGKIAFLAVKNSAEIFEKVNALLVERQKAKNEAAPVQPSVPASSNADELKKFKDLLDSGIITQEEFNAKKKELLGL